MSTQQKSFSSNLGAILAAVGSAVGLGNIWRFPYITGKYGGGAFLLVYLCFVFLLGSVLMISELVIGRRTRRTPLGAYESLTRKGHSVVWRMFGWLCVLTCFFILSQYLVLSGWTTGYVWHSVSGALATLGTDSSMISGFFQQFSTGGWNPVWFMVIFSALVLVVILGGVQQGVELASKVQMPILVVLILVLCVRSLTLPGAMRGVEYLFSPDFSKLTGEGILAALGQALFSLSVGMGVMVVYGSYLPANDNIVKTAMWITACDTLIAILAGVAIFPAVFSCGFDPAGGPGQVFCVLPNVFNSMNHGNLWGALFFLFMTFASFSTVIAVFETIISHSQDAFGLSRPKAALLHCVLLWLLSLPCALGWSFFADLHPLGGDSTILDFEDFLVSSNLLPLGALLFTLFCSLRCGWGWENFIAEVNQGSGLRLPLWFRGYLRWVLPFLLLLVFAAGYVERFAR